MEILNQAEIEAVSGGEGINLTFVSVNVPFPGMSAAISNLVSSLMMGHIDPATFSQAINDAGGNLVQYMVITPMPQPMMPPPVCPPPFPGPCVP